MRICNQISTGLRQRSFSRVAKADGFDVLIIGGGVNGIAVLRELSLNGVSALLIDHRDFCNGASSASSRMAHGGLRYLEGREFRLVAESAKERNRLIAQASHLVKPLEIVVPVRGIFTGFIGAAARFAGLTRKTGPMSLAALKAGLFVYELFGRVVQPMPRHRVWLKRKNFPQGVSAETRAVVSYYDGQITQPEGLMMEMLAEAMEADESCAALNHVNWHWSDGRCEITDVWGVHTHTFTPRLIVNASGAAIDDVNAKLGLKTEYLRGIKGAHLILDNSVLFARMNGRAFYFDDGTGRMVITLPVGRNILVGTTEIEASDPDDKSISEQEISYLLRAIDGLFHDISVSRQHIISMTSGIRPLRRGPKGASATAAARDHALERDVVGPENLPMLSLVGGKWTTFRAFAEVASESALMLLDRPRTQSTADRPYPGMARCTLQEICLAGRFDDLRARQLRDRYGAIARDVAAFCADWTDDAQLAGNPDYSCGEIAWLVLERGACTVEDIVMRRTQLQYGAGLRRDTAEAVGDIVASCLGRARTEIQAEIDRLMSDPRIMGCRTPEEPSP